MFARGFKTSSKWFQLKKTSRSYSDWRLERSQRRQVHPHVSGHPRCEQTSIAERSPDLTKKLALHFGSFKRSLPPPLSSILHQTPPQEQRHSFEAKSYCFAIEALGAPQSQFQQKHVRCSRERVRRSGSRALWHVLRFRTDDVTTAKAARASGSSPEEAGQCMADHRAVYSANLRGALVNDLLGSK